MNSFISCIEYRYKIYKIIKLKKEVIIQYIIDIDNKEFLFKFKGIENITNYILESKDTKKVGKLQIYRFVKYYTRLKIYFNYIYNFQRILYKDSKLIEIWFFLISNIQTKYNILDYNFYNFDETNFIIDIIYSGIIVINTERNSRNKII